MYILIREARHLVENSDSDSHTTRDYHALCFPQFATVQLAKLCCKTYRSHHITKILSLVFKTTLFKM